MMNAYLPMRTLTRAALVAVGIFALSLPTLASASPVLAASASGNGTLVGTVTNANTGVPVSRATITLAPGSLTTSTGADGGYSISVPAGSYSVTVSAFAYQLGVATVSIVSGQTTTRDFALEPSPSGATLRGQVLDQGHGYPLYAEVKVALNGNTVADTWTNPLNGHYRALLVTGNTYHVTVTSFIRGYDPGSATLAFNAGTRRSFNLSPNASCSAPGYGAPFREDFNGTLFPPEGWTVTPASSPVMWELNSSYPYGGDGNYTGGSGTAADADSTYNYGGDPFDTRLVSPPIQVADVGSDPVMTYLESFDSFGGQSLDLDISTDGGGTWTTVDHETFSCGEGVPPRCTKSFHLGTYLNGAPSFRLRWRYYTGGNGEGGSAQVDDVLIGACRAVPGGLVEGRVADRNTGHALTGATLTDETGRSTRSSAVPGRVHNGFFIFEPAGTHTLTASYPGYQSGQRHGSIANGQLRVVHYALRAGEFTLSPSPISVTAPVDTTTPVSLTIHNVGTGPAQWTLTSADAPAPIVRQNRPVVPRGVPPWRGARSHSDTWDSPAHGQLQRRGGPTRSAKTFSAASAEWTPIADYPIGVEQSCAATDETSGLVYVVGGYSHTSPTAAGYVYDPRSGIWSEIANAPVAWYGQACAMVDGKFYMTDGELSNHDRSRALYIYDPATDSWSRGADEPHSPYGGPAGVALDGKFYVIAGYVTAYDPASDSWSTLASYPSPDLQGDRSPSCGATEGKIYCAGGFYYNGSGVAVPIDYAYAYDPASNNWSPIASLPYAASGMAAGAGGTGGKFLVSLGAISTFGPFSAPTNKGAVYDVASETWSLLPDNLVTTGGAAGACGFYGFYTIGGQGNNYGITNAEVLPGRQVCGAGPAAYLSFAPSMGTLDHGQSATSVMTIDGTGQTAGTTSRIQVVLSGGPYPVIIVPLTIQWTAPSAPRKH